MIKSERRSLIKSFFALPFISPLSRLGAFKYATGIVGSETESEFDQIYRAVRILRFVNTVQVLFRKERGWYAGVEEFKSSDTVSRFLDSGRGEAAGIGTSLYGQLQFDQEEIVSGWQLALYPSADHLRYLALVRPLLTAKFPAFATDEQGLIQEGKPLDNGAAAHATRTEELVGSAEPIRTDATGSTSRLNLLLSGIFGPLVCTCLHCQPIPCCCRGCGCGGCQPNCLSEFNCCLNCGCSSCVWCVSG